MGACGLFLTTSTDVSTLNALMEMVQNDEYASNRIMANQALALCGNADLAFENIMRECTEDKNGSLYTLKSYDFCLFL